MFSMFQAGYQNLLATLRQNYLEKAKVWTVLMSMQYMFLPLFTYV